MKGISAELFEKVFDEGKFAKSICALNGDILNFNKAFKELFLISENDIVANNVIKLLSLFSNKNLENTTLINGFSDKITSRLELQIPSKGNRIIDFSSTNFTSNNVDLILITLEDITDKIIEKKNLLFSEQRLQLAASSFGMGIWDFDFIDQEFYLSDKVYDIFDITKQEFLNDPSIFTKIIHPDYFEEYDEKWKKGKENGGNYQLVTKIITKNNETRSIQINGVFLNEINQKPNRFIGTVIDITQLKKNEEDLIEERNTYLNLALQVEESKSNIQSLIDNFSNTSIWSIDRNYKLIACNDFFSAEHHKYFNRWITKGDNIIDPDFAPAEMIEYWKPLYDRAFQSESFEIEYEISGNYFLVSFNPIRVEKEILGVSVYGENVTAERKVNEVLRLNEERWKFALEGNNYGLWDYNVKENNLFFSPICNKILGYDMEEVLFPKIENWTENIHIDDLENTNAMYVQLLKGEIPSFAAELRLKTKDGSYKWILNKGKIFEFDIEGKASRIIGLFIDISARKEAETKINDYLISLEKFANITSHNLRLPVANIIGLVNLIEEEKNILEIKSLNNSLKISAIQLDEVIRDMNEAITYVYKEKKTTKQTKVSNIWFIDDDLINNMLSERMMKKHFPEIKSTSFLYADDAIQLLESKDTSFPDAIFLDINMPMMNGWDFLDQVEKLQLSVPVYMLTSSIDPKDQAKAHQYPLVKDFISKPLKEDRLKILIR
jgi:PAS domain S-box-containing protein